MEGFIIKKFFGILFVPLCLILTGCTKDEFTKSNDFPKTEEKKGVMDEKKEDFSPKNAKHIEFSINNQEFQIIPVFKPILEYIQKVEEHPEVDKKDLFISLVVEPFRKEAFGENGGMRLKDHPNFQAPLNVERLKEYIESLDENYEQISKIIKESLEKSVQQLPGGNITIYLFPFNPDDQYGMANLRGVAGIGTNNRVIVLHIAPNDFTETSLKYVICHEYHHIIHYERENYSKQDLVENVLAEGKADSFAKMFFPDYEFPWIAELSNEEVEVIWNWIDERRFSYNENDITDLLRGNNVLPRYANYRFGYHLMQQFLQKQPDISVKDWTFMTADEILELIGFIEK